MFRSMLADVLVHGVESAPRGKRVLELERPAVYVLTDPHRPLVLSKTRDVFYRFGFVEASWILAGDDRLAPLAKVNPRMTQFSDDGITLYGAYGPRLMSQLDHVVNSLRNDPHSRQATVSTWRPDRVSRDTKDTPCTVAWHFQLRDGALDLRVFMRSHDAWLGMPYDVMSFTTVQRVVASMLGVAVGEYVHVLSNLHLYEEHWELARQVLDETHPWDKVVRVPEFGRTFFGRTAIEVKNMWYGILEGDRTTHSGPVAPYLLACRGERNPLIHEAKSVAGFV